MLPSILGCNEDAGVYLKASEGFEIFVHADLPQEHLEAGVDGEAEGGELLDDVAKYDVRHHGVPHKHDARHHREVQEIGAREQQRAGHDTEARLEVHEVEDACDNEQNVDTVQCIVPRERVDQELQHQGCLVGHLSVRGQAEHNRIYEQHSCALIHPPSHCLHEQRCSGPDAAQETRQGPVGAMG